MSYNLMVNRIIELYPAVYWNQVPISAHLMKFINWDKIKEVSKSFDSFQMELTNEEHLGRIKYLMLHDWYDDIDISGTRDNKGIEVFDGNHRLLAAVALGRLKISCNFNGSLYLFAYLNGDIDVIEFEETDAFDSYADSAKSLLERWGKNEIKQRFSVEDRIKFCQQEIAFLFN